MLVGTATVKIVADVSKLASDIERQLGRIDVSRIGQDLGDAVGQGLRERVEAKFADLPGLLTDNASDFKAAGQLMGDEFGNGFIDNVKAKLAGLSGSIDGQALGQQLGADASDGFSQSFSVEQALRQQIQNAGSAAQGDAEGIGAQINTSISNGLNRNPFNVDFGGIGGDGGNSAGAGFMASFNQWFDNRSQAPFEGFIKSIASNFIQIGVLQGVIVGVVGAISSLVSATVALSSALAYAAPAALKFGNALFAMAQGAIVARGLFSGLGQAIQAYRQVEQAQAGASREAQQNEADRLLRIREARKALNDAIIDGARSNQDAVERVSDAHEALRDAIEGVSDAQESLSDAIEGVADAEESLSDAIRNEQRALEGVNDARQQAKERLEDLQMSLERSALTEERAALNLKKAEKRLAEARAGGNANAIYEADLAYREQMQTMKEVQERNGDLRDEANKANAEGVNGNRQVLDAQEAYRDAVERTSDATEALADAQERVRDAQEGVADATERVSDAQRALKRAIEDVPRTAEEVALRIARAQQNLKDAIKGTDTSVQTATNNMNDAFAKLDPAAQRFVRFWVDQVLPVFERIKKAGQAVFFPKLQEAIQNLLDDSRFIPMLEKAFIDTSGVLGDFAINLSEAFTTPQTLDALETILESNTVILRNLADAAVNLVQPLSQIFAATAPLAEDWSESVKKATETFKEFIAGKAVGGEDSELNKFFVQAQELASSFWRIIKNVGKGIGGIFESALGPGRYLLASLEAMTSQWSTLMQNPANQAEMSNTFAGAASNAMALVDLLGDVIGALFRIGANPAIGDIARAIERAMPAFEQFANDSLTQISGAIVKIIDAAPDFMEFFSNTGTIQTFSDIVATVVEKVGDFLGFISDLNDKFIVAQENSEWLQNLKEWISDFTGIDWIEDLQSWDPLKTVGGALGLFAALKLITGLGGSAFKKVADGISSIKNSLKATKDAAKAAVDGLKGLVDKFKEWRGARKAEKQGKFDFALWEEDGKKDRKGRKAAGKAAREKYKVDLQAEVDKNKLEREIDEMADTLRRQLEEQAKKTAAAAKIHSEVIGDGTIDGIRAGMREKFPDLKNAADDVVDAIYKQLKESAGIQSPSTLMKTKIGGPLVEGIESALKNADFSVAAADLMNEIETELRQSATAANIDQVGRGMGAELERGLKAATETTGTEVGQEIKRDLDLSTEGVTAIGTEMGNSVERGLKTATETTGGEVGREIKRDFSRALDGMSAEAYKEGREAATRAKLGAKSVGPVVINSVVTGGGAAGGLGGGLGGGKGAGKDIDDAAKKTGKFGKVMGGVSKIMGKIGLKALGKGFLFMLGPIGAVIGAVWMVIDILGMFGISLDQIINFFKNFGTEAPKIWAKITEGFSKAWEAVKTWFSDNFVPWIKGLGEKIGEIAGDIWGWIVEKAGDIVSALGTWFTDSFVPWLVGLPADVANLYIDIWGWILTKAWDILKAVGRWFIDSFVPWLVGLPGKIVNLGLNIWGWILDKAKDILKAIGTWFTDSFVPWLTSMPGKIVNLGLNIWGWIIDKAKALITALKTWLNDSFIPWVKALPGKVAENIGNLFGSLKTKAEDGFTALKSFFTDKVMPWVQGLPQRFADGMKGLWDGLKSGAAKASNWVIGKINEYIIPSLNKLPFVELKGLSEIPGYATGGQVRGPDKGNRADNVLARLTPGEFVLNRKMVAQMGPSALERWRRTGELPQGGWWDDAKAWVGRGTDWIKGKVPDIDQLVMKGAFYALKKIIETGLNLMPEKDGMVGNIKRYLKENISILQAYAKKQQKKIDDAQATTSGSPVNYNGPKDGWTYPLARRFPSYTRQGHNPWYAYDIGSPSGIPVIAVSSGVVTKSANLGNRSYGQYIQILHHDGARSLYAHLSERNALVGMQVRAGQKIGVSGNTGGSSGPHLHFELGFADAREMMRRRGVRLAEGGIVRATPGGIDAIIGEGGRDERVTPLDSKGRSQTEVEMLAELRKLSDLWASGGRGNNVFQVFPAPGMSERELAVKISREVAFLHRRRA